MSSDTTPGIEKFNQILRRCTIPEPMKEFKATLDKIKFGDALNQLAIAAGLGDHSFEVAFVTAHGTEPFHYIAAVHCKSSPKEPLPRLPKGWTRTQEGASKQTRWTYHDAGSDTRVHVTIEAADKSVSQSIVGFCIHLRAPEHPTYTGTQGLVVRKERPWDTANPVFWTMSSAHLFNQGAGNGVWFCYDGHWPAPGSCPSCEAGNCNVCTTLTAGFKSKAANSADILLHSNVDLDFAIYSVIPDQRNEIVPLVVSNVTNSPPVQYLFQLNPNIDNQGMILPMQAAFHGLNQVGDVIVLSELLQAVQSGQRIFAFTRGMGGGWAIGHIASASWTEILVSQGYINHITQPGDSGGVWFALLPTGNGAYVARPFGCHFGTVPVEGFGGQWTFHRMKVIPYGVNWPNFAELTLSRDGVPAFYPGDSYVF